MPHRIERIGHAIRSVVAHAIQSRLSDPRIEPFTSVTRVEVSGDLSVARVYVSVMAADARQKLCLAGLRHAAGRLRAMVARRVVLRQVPRLDFLLDDSVQRAFQTVQAIDAAMAELGEHLPWEDDEDPDADAGNQPKNNHDVPADPDAKPDNGAHAGMPEDD